MMKPNIIYNIENLYEKLYRNCAKRPNKKPFKKFYVTQNAIPPQDI